MPVQDESRPEQRLTALSHGGGCGCKIDPGMLERILSDSLGHTVPPQLLVGIGTSDDAAVWQLDDSLALVATTDFFMPIVDDPREFGRIAATNALSDVYAMGARPIMALALVGMPTKVLSESTIATILRGGAEICAEAGIPVAGGHTIDAIEPFYGLVAIGLVHPGRIKANTGARPGDVLVLGKRIGVGILSGALKAGALDSKGHAELVASMTRLNTPGSDLGMVEAVHAMTDVTGFGLAGHVLEMARGSGCNVEIEWASVPCFPEARELAAAGYVTGASARNWASYGSRVDLPAGFDPFERALLSDPQTSGGLLVACAPEALSQVMAIFHSRGFDATSPVGRVLDRSAMPRLRVIAT